MIMMNPSTFVSKIASRHELLPNNSRPVVSSCLMSVWGTVVSELPFSCHLVGLTLPSPWLGRGWESTAVGRGRRLGRVGWAGYPCSAPEVARGQSSGFKCGLWHVCPRSQPAMSVCQTWSKLTYLVTAVLALA